MTSPGAGAPAALRARLALASVDGGAFSPRRCAELDREEAFPDDQFDLLDEFGLAAFYVPAEWGGRLDDYEALVRLVRVVASHDLSAAVAHAKTFLGGVCVWLAGNPGQARGLAREVLAGAQVSWALSEREHGADLLAAAATARRDGRGYRLDGTKWPINNVTRSSHVCVLVRTDPRGGNRGHSLFLIDKARVAPNTMRLLPKVRTHGIRGIDISGICFAATAVDEADRVGDEGAGVETVLRALQLTRTMCGGLSLGAGEHALRLATIHACQTAGACGSLVTRREAREVLARSAGLLIATEAAVVLAARSIHFLPGELSAISPVVKALAPTLVDGLIGDLSGVLGDHAWLMDGLEHGGFQKLRRDHQIVAIFDGSTAVSRNALINQFPLLARRYHSASADTDGLASACRLTTAPRPALRSKLTLVSRGGVSALSAAREAVEGLMAAGGPAGLLAEARALVQTTDLLHDAIARLRPEPRPPAVAYELAAAYELCFAAAACLHIWVATATPQRPDGLWQDALWVRAALRELRRALRPLAAAHLPQICADADTADADPTDAGVTDPLVDWLVDAVERGEPLSAFESVRYVDDAG